MGNHKNMLKVDNVWVKSPSSMTVHIQDISRSNAGRTEDGLMHKERIARKVKIDLQWSNPSPEDAQAILSAFAPEYVQVQFVHPLTNTATTKTFYSGDQDTPVKIWTVGNKRYESISFNIIER